MHFLQRVADELSSYKLKTIYSYEFSMGHWQIALPDSINAIVLGKGEEAIGQHGFKALKEGWARGKALVREIKASNPSVVMILGYGNISHFIVLEWCKFTGIPCLMWGDSNIKGDNNGRIKAWVKKKILSRVVSRCSALLPCGNLGAQYFQKYGARPEQIFFVPNEPDYSLIEQQAQSFLSEIATEFGLSANRRRLIYSGRLVNIKRVDLLIDAFVSIANQRNDWDLLIAGNGPLETELKIRMPDKFKERVIWTGFVSSSEKMAALYNLSDVLVLPSDYEPWALVINEAACAGLAIVSSDVVGAAAELVRDGINGRLFKSSDLISLIDALLDVTEMSNLPMYKKSSIEILHNWRQSTDPVVGFHRALEYSLTKDI
jgi:glycosyltransferase involved in cell wall biosynthesis